MACLPEDISPPRADNDGQTIKERPPAPLAEDGEYYFDGPLFVFTAAYHLRRGYCCGNDCRHCPYDIDGNPVPGKGTAQQKEE